MTLPLTGAPEAAGEAVDEATAASVFVSYSSRNRAVADVVRDGLEQRGLRCWMAPRDILPGREWSEAIIEGINGAPVMLLLLSPASSASQQVRREVERAISKHAALVALHVEPKDPAAPDDSSLLELFLKAAHHIEPEHEESVASQDLDDTATLIHALLSGRRPAAPPASPAPSPAQVRPPVLAAPTSAAQPVGRGGATSGALPRPEPAKSDAPASRRGRGWNWGAFWMTWRWNRAHNVLPGVPVLLASCLFYGALLALLLWNHLTAGVGAALLVGLVPRVWAGLRGSGAVWRRLPDAGRASLQRTRFGSEQGGWAQRGLRFWIVLGAVAFGVARTAEGQHIGAMGRALFETQIARPLKAMFGEKDLMRRGTEP